MLKYRQALRAASVLMRQPFEFVALNAMTDAVSLSWPVQWWYRRLIKDVPQRTLDYLRELTRRPIDFDALERMPESTLGHQYIKFMKESGIPINGHVKAVPALRETFEKDWVTQRFFKIHDILHVVAGFDATVQGEMGLQMFDARNLREPYGIASVASTPYMMLIYGGPARMLREIARGWEVGSRGDNLFFAPFEEMWGWDLADVRVACGLAPRRRWGAARAAAIAASSRDAAAHPNG